MIKQVLCQCGIGDNMIALLCCNGLKQKYPNDHIVFATNAYDWMNCFNGYDELVKNPIPASVTYRPYDSYKLERKQGLLKQRASYYADFCDNVTPILPTVKPLPPSPFPGATVLVPFAAWQERTYPVGKWVELEKELGPCIILDDKRPPGRCDVLKGQKVIGQAASLVMAILAQAKVVICNDSGMGHVAGALGTPTVVLSSWCEGDKVFGVYPSVKVVQGSCWNDITVERIMAALKTGEV